MNNTQNNTQTARETPEVPHIGQTMIVRGQVCMITKVRPLGTVDVETLDGERAYRVTGLPFI